MAVSLEIILLILLAVVLVVVFIASRKQQSGLQRQLQQQRLEHDQLQAQFKLLLSAAQGVGDRLHQVETDLSNSKNLATQNNSASNGDVSVRQAIELARKGATVDELVDLCGLSRGEAELMSTIHNVGSR